MNTYNVEIIETRRYAVTVEAETREHANELALSGQAQGCQLLEVTGLEVERIGEADPAQGGGND